MKSYFFPLECHDDTKNKVHERLKEGAQKKRSKNRKWESSKIYFNIGYYCFPSLFAEDTFHHFEFVDKNSKTGILDRRFQFVLLRADLFVRLVPGTFLVSDSQPEYRDTKGCREEVSGLPSKIEFICPFRVPNLLKGAKRLRNIGLCKRMFDLFKLILSDY